MAEVRKRENVEEYKIDKKDTKKNSKKVEKPVTKKDSTKKANNKQEKKSLWVRFRIFCHGVKSETGKVHWPGRKDMLKYSIATIVFIIFCSLFFYAIDIIFALIQSIFK